MTQTDIQLNKQRPPLRSLLTILRFEVWTFETLSHCRSWLLVNRERPDSEPDYPWPCVRVVKITRSPHYSPRNGSLGCWIITWFYPLRTYAFTLLARFDCRLLLIATPKWSSVDLWRARRQPKGQEIDVQTDLRGECHTSVSIYYRCQLWCGSWPYRHWRPRTRFQREIQRRDSCTENAWQVQQRTKNR